jgi:hypothetical protein
MTESLVSSSSPAAKRMRLYLDFAHIDFVICIVRVRQETDGYRIPSELARQLQPFCHQLDCEYAHRREVAFGPVQTAYIPGLDRIAADGGNDWDRAGRGPGSTYRPLAAACNDDSHRPGVWGVCRMRQRHASIRSVGLLMGPFLPSLAPVEPLGPFFLAALASSHSRRTRKSVPHSYYLCRKPFAPGRGFNGAVV